MPELSPKQLTIWLAIAAVVLFIGARAMRGEDSVKIDPGQAVVGAGAPGSATADPAREQRLHFEDGPEVSGQDQGQRLHVHVAGAVRRPGLYRLIARSRVADALRRAGGAADNADLDRINLATILSDGQQILVPRRGEPAAESTGDRGSTANGTTEAAAPISLSMASAAELESIDGIGPVTAAKILEFRDSEGAVESVEQLDVIPGIGPATMQTLRQALVP